MTTQTAHGILLKMKLPISYTNGTTVVTTNSNGVTTVVDTSGQFKSDFPDTIDLKVTNKCDAGCWFCHENSTLKGKHAELLPLLQILKDFPRGIQLAVGGGNPLAWPDLEDFLISVSGKFVVNMTINAAHLTQSSARVIKRFQDQDMIHGLGISAVGPDFSYASLNYNVDYGLKNVVGHFIVGRVEDWLLRTQSKELFQFVVPKLLFLGYKSFGRGDLSRRSDRAEDILSNIEELKKQVPNILRLAKSKGVTLSFDNLALEQLDIKRYIDPDVWDKHYLGDEGVRSMYIDAVSQTSGKSSADDLRFSWIDKHPLQVFKDQL